MLPIVEAGHGGRVDFSFQNTWNDFLGPLVFLQKAEVKTIILGLYA